ncbi:short-chain dehydrogenase/reductase family protein, putative [Talaromyces stipitatus ATCC 10500]|uniref:Short-chain dehydrogenase/reductase family protein, putative n=1 Tax=Talaromyces stipitatus (strain ATCC 10500 / CBS 375.48 / QM 6759 / NRRL 1006) TaxID=441959 RepID=B8MND4_TALSN|nr:short-chain dehydrogenase/reductase family protein, putative [Talaromyces stipitatus ATCC 10500]EED14023.1 short-chain dehydrogenase/reductase family protein, putative [Talaromyces stipitatus ATCC 10500]
MDFRDWLHSQLCVTLPVPTKRYSGLTIIVTGSNVGIGLETARYFVFLDAAKVILAVRNTAKGEAAAKSIIQSTGRTGVVEVWHLDLASYDSVKAFAERASSLERLDILVNNAGILVYKFELAEDNESTITVNVVSSMLLSLLLLPKLRETSVRYGKENVLTFTGSFVHFMTDFPERKAPNIFKELANKERANMKNRYYVSKLVQLLIVRGLANQITNSTSPGDITVSIANPGFVKTEVMRNASVSFHLIFRPWRKLVARSAEEGARTILHAAAGGKETHGQYLSDCKVAETSEFVRSNEGEEVQKKLWAELSTTLERIVPGVMKNIS